MKRKMKVPRQPRKFRHVIIAVILALSLVPVLALSVYFGVGVTARIEEEAHQNLTLYLSSFADTVEDCLSSVDSAVNYLMTSRDIADNMAGNTRLTPEGLRALDNLLSRSLLFDQNWKNKFMKAMFVFFDDETYASVMREGYYNVSIARSRKVYDRYETNTSRPQLVYPEDLPYSYIVCDFLNIHLQGTIGTIVVELDADTLLNDDRLATLYSGAQVMIYDADGNVFLNSNADGAFPQVNCARSYDFERVSFKNRNYIAVSRDLDAYGLKCLVLVPAMGLYSGYGWVIAALLAIFAAALGLSVMLSRFVLRSFFLPLGALTKRMEAFSGNTAPAEDIAASPYLEVDALNRAYTNMAGEISTLVNEAYTLKLLNHEAELDLLQSQLDPHFLFNILSGLQWQAQEAGDGRLVDMIAVLSQSIRATLTYARDDIRLRDEIDQIERYLTLRDYSLGGRLTYEIEVESPDLLQLRLPKYLIKPLVECIIAETEVREHEKNEIELHFYRHRDTIRCKIVNRIIIQGRGRNAPDRRRMSFAIRQNAIFKKVLGRARLIYGDRFKISILLPASTVSVFKLRIPVRELPDERGEAGEE